MKTVLVTGANKSIGYEVARQLAGHGMRVLLAARDHERGERAAAALRQETGAHVQFVPLDVTSPESIDGAVDWLRQNGGTLDILVNNAGVLGEMKPPSQATAEAMRATFETNVVGTVMVTQRFLPLLRQAADAHVIMVTSGLSSLRQHEPGQRYHERSVLAYSVSKTALNMAGLLLANELRPEGIRVTIVDPGYTATEFNGFAGPQTIAEGAEAIVKLATGELQAESGTFVDRHGSLPW